MSSEFSKNAIERCFPQFIEAMRPHCDPRDFPAFERFLRKRLAHGAEAYGDESFHRSPLQILEEMEFETFDVPDWGFILTVIEKEDAALYRDVIRWAIDSYKIWHKMQRVKKRLRAKETLPQD